MIQHYIVIAIRNMLKHWKFTLINIIGLSIGLASFLIIFFYIHDELSYDEYHEKADRIYRVNRYYNSGNAQEDAASCSFPCGPNILADYPDLVENVVRLFDFQQAKMFFDYQQEGKETIKFNEDNFYLADSSVFDIFTFEFITGDKDKALDRPNTIVLTESTARRYFGDNDPIGKRLRLEENVDFEVTGVIADLPSQSHLRIDLLGSLSTFRQLGGGQYPRTWIWNPCWTYVLLHKGVKPEQLDAKFGEFYNKHYFDLKNADVRLYLQALTDIHLKSDHVYEMHSNGNISQIYILIAISIIVLVLACINYTNLTTAKASARAKEIGVKKSFGSTRREIVYQFLGEAFFQALFAILLAVCLIELLVPYYNQLSGKYITTDFLTNPFNILVCLALIILVSLLGGSYPSVHISRLIPVNILRGEVAKGASGGVLRKTLVIVQFTISISLIIGVLVVSKQIKYLQKADIGFNKEQIIVLPTVFQVSGRYEEVKKDLLKFNNIKSVTACEDILGVNHNTRAYRVEGVTPDQDVYYPTFIVRDDFIETFGLRVVSGRAFSNPVVTDTADAVMISEAMVKYFGWNNESALGKKFTSIDGVKKVIGVFSDINALSLHRPVNNFVLEMYKNRNAAIGLTRYIAVKVNTADYEPTLEYIKDVWNKYANTRPFEYMFLDDQINELYNDEMRFRNFTIVLSVLALVIAGLGLLGLVLFLIEKRTKEIGVRKVMGAGSFSIIKVFSKEFILLIMISNLIAWPLSFFVVQNWLNNFSKRIDLDIVSFIMASVIVMLFAISIIGIKVYLSSLKNPSKALRYE